MLFNQAKFFEAHDVWEELWRSLKGDPKLLMQGLVQAAVGAHHLQRGNRRGALSLFRNSLCKFSGGPRRFCGVDLRRLVHDLKELLEVINETIPRDSRRQITLRTRRPRFGQKNCTKRARQGGLAVRRLLVRQIIPGLFLPTEGWLRR